MARFRRPIIPHRRRFPTGRRSPLRPGAARIALNRLQEAHALMAQGKPKEAAEIFSALADAGAKRGVPRAAQLNLQAGRALIEANDLDPGLRRIRQGLTMMATMGQITRLPYVGRRVLEELKNRGLSQQAAAIEAEIQSLLSPHGLSLATTPGSVGGQKLPVKCRYCGGNVHPDEVDWLDDRQAACAYCGSLLRDET